MAEDESCENRKLLPLVFLQTSRILGGIRRKEECYAGGGTGRLNLPGEFMTELFKGCLVVLNPVTAALAFPSSLVSRFEPTVHSCFPCALMFSRLPFLFSIFERRIQAGLVPPWLDENQMPGIFRVTTQTFLSVPV